MRFNIVNPDKISLEKNRKSFKNAINVVRKGCYVAELLNLRKVLIDGACPELVEGPHPALRKFNNQAPKYKGVKIENFGSAKRILFLGKLKYDMQ